MKKYFSVLPAIALLASCASSPQSVVFLDGGVATGAIQSNRIAKPTSIATANQIADVQNTPPAPVASRYRLGKGDVFSINVFNEPDLSKSKIRMSDAGTVQYISMGEVVVEGMSVSDLEALITKTLKGTYLTEPKVTVSIDEYRPVFMSGQVAKTGIFPYQPGLTVLRAITIAGGFAPRADEKKLYIQKENNPGQLILVGPNTYVEPGDIISVGESFF